MDNSVWVAFIGLIGVVFNGVTAYLLARLSQKTTAAAAKAEEVKAALIHSEAVSNRKLDDIKRVTSDKQETLTAVSAALAENTAVTKDTKAVVDKVQEQTNGARERLEEELVAARQEIVNLRARLNNK